MNPRELLDVLSGLGANVKNHMSLVDEQFVTQVRRMYAGGAHTVTVRPTTMAVPARQAATQTPVVAQSEAASPVALKPPADEAGPLETASAVKVSRPMVLQDELKQRSAAGTVMSPPSRAPVRPLPVSRPGTHQPSPGGVGVGAVRRSPAAKRGTQTHGSQASMGRKGEGAGRGVERRARPPESPERSGRQTRRPTAQGRGGRYTGQAVQIRAPQPVKRSLELPPSISVKNLAAAMAQPVGEVIKRLMGLGVLATINQEIDYETAAIMAHDLGNEVRPAPSLEDKLKVAETADAPETLVSRPPVVTVMGHVDHGKTSLLDAIRETNVTAQEAGGITQHIGAYQVELKGRRITFLDTPGHEAFTAMRARGAQVTDIAILVVAADDGVMPQTIEAINHAKAANVPIIVALNKIDKPQANPERVKQELTEHGLVAEVWGGETIVAEVSAVKHIGLDHLLEMILLVADLRDLRANPDRPAKGTIIEAQLDRGHGPVATVLVQNGTLELGDTIIAGAVAGRVRALVNDKGKRVRKAGPSTPVEVIGLDGLPAASDELFAIKDDHLARQVADQRQQLKRESGLRRTQPMTLDELFNRVKEGGLKDLKVIVKADVHGSAEALRQSLERIANEQLRVTVIHSGVGTIIETDVMLAAASNAIIIGFNVRPEAGAKRLAEKEQVDIRLYRIIYDAIADVEAALEGMLAPEYREVVLGRAEVRTIFKVPKIGNIAGSYVAEGRIVRNVGARVLRDHKIIYEGKIDSLRRFKDDVREVALGFECGIGLERFNDIKEGDAIEAFTMEEIKRESKQ